MTLGLTTNSCAQDVDVQWGEQCGDWTYNDNGGGPTIDWTEQIGTDLAPWEGYNMNDAIMQNEYNLLTGYGEYAQDSSTGEPCDVSGYGEE